jgi:uncharacterized membrane protein YcaP (DUF421 family)
MDKYSIHIDDFKRILFGTAPAEYLLEVVVRVSVVYLIILLAIRLIGKRMTAQLGRAELATRVALGAAVGMAIVRPGRGMLISALIVLIIYMVNKLISKWLYASKKLEAVFQEKVAVLISEGVLDPKKMADSHVSKERVFAALRQEGIKHLGQVACFCIESNGEFSLLESKSRNPGLAVIPEWDIEFRKRQKQAVELFCMGCGSKANQTKHCSCGCDKTEHGIL